jgi:hypothetical protein
MHRVLVALVAVVVIVGVVGEVRRLTWSDEQLQAHAARAADALAAQRKAADPLMRPGPAEKMLRSAATTPVGLQQLRRRLKDRLLLSICVLSSLTILTVFLWRRNRIAHAICVVTCAIVTAGALSGLVSAVRGYRLVGDTVVTWELVELLLLAVLGLAVVVVAMLAGPLREAEGGSR